jgi:hypothetical protein
MPVQGRSVLSISYEILSDNLLSRLSPYIDEIIGHHQYDFDVTDQLLITFLQSSGNGENKGSTMRQ